MSLEFITGVIDDMITVVTNQRLKGHHVFQNMDSEISKLYDVQEEMREETEDLPAEVSLGQPYSSKLHNHEKTMSPVNDEPVTCSLLVNIPGTLDLEASKLEDNVVSTGSCDDKPSTSNSSASVAEIGRDEDEAPADVGGRPRIVSHLLSQATMLSCDICKKPCEKAASLHCCQAQGCRI